MMLISYHIISYHMNDIAAS